MAVVLAATVDAAVAPERPIAVAATAVAAMDYSVTIDVVAAAAVMVLRYAVARQHVLRLVLRPAPRVVLPRPHVVRPVHLAALA